MNLRLTWRRAATTRGTYGILERMPMTSEFMALRKRVAEAEAPSARKMTTKQLEEDRNYWKAKALEIVGGRVT